MELTAGLPHKHCTSEIETSVYVRLPKGEQPNHKCLSCVLHWPHKTCIMSAPGRGSEFSIEFFTIGVSVRLSDRSLHREEQNKFRQKLPPVGIETRTSRSSGQCLTN